MDCVPSSVITTRFLAEVLVRVWVPSGLDNAKESSIDFAIPHELADGGSILAFSAHCVSFNCLPYKGTFELEYELIRVILMALLDK